MKNEDKICNFVYKGFVGLAMRSNSIEDNSYNPYLFIHWCGYVGLSKGHQYYGKNYNDIPITVYGGLTYSGYWDNSNNRDKLWFIGFDCAHLDDLGIVNLNDLQFNFSKKTYKDLNFVIKEIKLMIDQLCENEMIIKNETTNEDTVLIGAGEEIYQ